MTGETKLALRRQRRLSEVLTDSFNILFAHWKQLAYIAAPLVLATVVMQLILNSIAADWPVDEPVAPEDIPIGEILLFLLVVSIAVPVQFVLYQLVSGAGVAYLDGIDRGTGITPADALGAARDRLGALIGAAIRATVIVLLLVITIVGIPWAIARIVRWLFLNQAIMLDGKSGQEVLAHSAAVVRGRWWGTLGRVIVTALVIGIPVSVLSQALSQVAPGVIGTVLSSATAFISVPFGIISLTLIYLNLQVQQQQPHEPAPQAGYGPAPMREFAYLNRDRLQDFVGGSYTWGAEQGTASETPYAPGREVDDSTAARFESLLASLRQRGVLHRPDDPPGQAWPHIEAGEFIDIECAIEFTALDTLIERFRQFGPPPGLAPPDLDFASVWLRPGQQPLGGRVFVSAVELRYVRTLKSQLAGRYRVLARVQQVLEDDDSLDLPTLFPGYNLTYEEVQTMIADRATMRRYGRVPVMEEFVLAGPALVLTLVAVYR